MKVLWLFYVAVGLLALVGASSLLIAAIFKDDSSRRMIFKVGTYGLILTGLALMLGSMSKLFGSNELFDGLLLIVFGTGAEMLPAKAK
jgi:peptidoglycan/LPS O-acetylase OafA/YrhL